MSVPEKVSKERYVLKRPLESGPAFIASQTWKEIWEHSYETLLIDNARCFTTMDEAENVRERLKEQGKVYQLLKVTLTWEWEQ